uniref:uncharacterized protein LOC131138794 n=1 Tax=Doryrhamphus excisus TaxID=161450 RepID=UPI0025AE0BB4|nr:uncharacterized protein LOC131138794 [Doryrhamphus excisus]
MPKRKCKFTDKLERKFPCFRPGRDEWEAECMKCKPGTFVTVSNKGAGDLEAHVSSTKHQNAAKNGARVEWIKQEDDSLANKPDDDVTAAEGVFAFHTSKHHNSYRSSDCTSALLKKAFPDSATARNFSSARTKTEAIINAVIAPHSVDVALESLAQIPYCGVSADWGDHGAGRISPVLVQYFDWKNGGMQSKLIEVSNDPSIRETLERSDILAKCVAFTGDTCNTMFRPQVEAFSIHADLQSSLQNQAVMGVGCPAHVLNNCVYYGANTLDVDIESIILKIYQYFHMYSVRTEPLGQYCEFAVSEYRNLLSHSKTQWLSLFPGIEKLLHTFPALKAFFLLQEKPPLLIRDFFGEEFSEIYLWQMHSLMCVFHSPILEMEREDNSVVEVKNILDKVHTTLLERKAKNFMPLKVRAMLAQKLNDGFGPRCDHFTAQVHGLYSSCLEYLETWMAPMEQFSSFMWMDLSQTPDWNRVEACVNHLAGKGVLIDDVRCFDEAHQKWSRFFQRSGDEACHSELLKMAQFVFAIPPHGANVERIFSLVQSQLTKERNHLSQESLKGLLCTQYNFKHMSCKDFHAYLLANPALLAKMRSSEKYGRPHKSRLMLIQ